MKTKSTVYSAAVLFAVAACGQPVDGRASARSDAAVAESNAFAAVSGEYTTDERHHYITFSYLHMGFSHPWLRWRDWEATLDWNAENPEQSSVEAVIDAESIDSGVDEFDGHLQGERFFDTAKHPEITFVSTKVERTGDNTGVITGDLTIKDITVPVSLDVTFNKADFDERSGYKLGFSGKAVVKRSDFGMTYAIPIVSDEIEIVIEAEFVKPADGGE